MADTQVANRKTDSRLLWLGVVLTVAVGVVIAAGLGSALMSSSWQSAIRVVGLGAVVVVILLKPIYGLLLWLILEPFTRFWYLSIHVPAGVPDLSLSRLSVAILAVVWLAQLATRKKHLRRFGLTEVCMLLMLLFMIPSILSSLKGVNSALQVVVDKFVSPFAFFLLAKNLYEDREGIDRLTAALVIIESYLCFVLFYEHLTGQPLFYVPGRTMVYTAHLRKIVGLLQNAAFLATILAMIAPVALYRFKRAKTPLSRFFFGAVFALAVIGNFLCYNRGAWLAMAAARLNQPQKAVDALLFESSKNQYSACGINKGGPANSYFPGNGGLLYAVAMMAAGWEGAPDRKAPGFPSDGSWEVRCEGLVKAQ